MPRKRRIPKLRRVALTPGLLEFLQTGDHWAHRAQAAGLCGPWALFVEAPLEQHQLQRWREHGAEVMEIHLRQWPGTRPYAWWRWSATEPRRVLTGAELLKPTSTPSTWQWWWSERFGIPAFNQIRPRGYVGVPSIESQAAYLLRLNLLTDEERGRLTPADFQPEDHDPFRISQGELEQALAPGGDVARGVRQLARDLSNPRTMRA